MDLAFSRRADPSLIDGAQPRLDYDVLVASLAALQSPQAGAGSSAHDPLIELLTGGPDWRKAVALQDGCFNRAVRRGNQGVG